MGIYMSTKQFFNLLDDMLEKNGSDDRNMVREYMAEHIADRRFQDALVLYVISTDEKAPAINFDSYVEEPWNVLNDNWYKENVRKALAKKPTIEYINTTVNVMIEILDGIANDADCDKKTKYMAYETKAFFELYAEMWEEAADDVNRAWDLDVFDSPLSAMIYTFANKRRNICDFI